MPILDFKEIPPGNLADGMQDTFELFARDVLAYMGFEVLNGPDRGQDAGRDLIVAEERVGVGGKSVVKWLVSCKHKAHSGGSVTLGDEADLGDRLKLHGCAGFVGFYSTLPASSLQLKARGVATECLFLDRERIEGELLRSAEGCLIASRYFPTSWTQYLKESPTPAPLYDFAPTLECAVCKKDLLNPLSGIIVFRHLREEAEEVSSGFDQCWWVCKGRCDRIAEDKLAPAVGTTWEEISDIAVPSVFIKWVAVLLGDYIEGRKHSPGALAGIRALLIGVFPHVSRHLTSQELERIGDLKHIPGYLGGLGE